MTSLRTLCPATCQCDLPFPGIGGFYQAEEWGCPSDCTSWQNLEVALLYDSLLCTDQLETYAEDLNTWQKYVYGLRDYVNRSTAYSSYIEWMLAYYLQVFNV